VVLTGNKDLASEYTEVYPNPTSTGWQLYVGADLIGSTVEIFDATGRLVFKSEIRSSKSEIEPEVAVGVYLLRINTSGKSIVKKLMKI
jgi:hypothetical protein